MEYAAANPQKDSLLHVVQRFVVAFSSRALTTLTDAQLIPSGVPA
jgi:hypothetical protein